MTYKEQQEAAANTISNTTTTAMNINVIYSHNDYLQQDYSLIQQYTLSATSTINMMSHYYYHFYADIKMRSDKARLY